jgi:hypothetical protein
MADIPEGSTVHSDRCENLESDVLFVFTETLTKVTFQPYSQQWKSKMSKREAQKKLQDKSLQKKTNREEDRAQVQKCIETLRGLLQGKWAWPYAKFVEREDRLT